MKTKIVKLVGEKDQVLFENTTSNASQVLKIFFGKRQPGAC